MIEQLRKVIDTKTKPIGSLGKIEKIAMKLGVIQQTVNPVIIKPRVLVFAGDHGIAKDGASPFPQEVTFQMVMNFLQGGAAINVFAKQNGLDVTVVDAGVNFDFEEISGLINAKVAYGTKSFLQGPAMSMAQCENALNKGAAIVEDINGEGCNTVIFGEMGIGNTSSSAALFSRLARIPIKEVVGAGTGFDEEGIKKKADLIQQGLDKNPTRDEPKEILATFGGFEIAMIAGGMLKAAELGMIIIVDGFITTAAMIMAHAMKPKVLLNAIFGHKSDEQAHQRMLDYLGEEPILDLGLRLGEGTGAALAFPIVQAAVNMLNEMASFDSAGVSNKE